MGKIGYTGGAITIMVIFFFIAACLIAYSISNKKNDIIQMILIISSIVIACIPFYYRVPATPIVQFTVNGTTRTVVITNKSDYVNSSNNFTVSDLNIISNRNDTQLVYNKNNIVKNPSNLSWNNVNLESQVAAVRAYNTLVYSESNQFNVV
jgi:hypothetical protein